MYSDWTTTFFRGLAVEFWVTAAPQPAPSEIEFLQSIFGSGGEILDLACGAGRYAIPLANAGYDITAIDSSNDFLEIGQARLPVLRWVYGDIRDLPWSDRFDGAMCFGNSFGYFPRNETRAFLHGVARSLRTGARFVLETMSIAETLLPSLQLERTIEMGSIVFSSKAVYDAPHSRLDTQYSFERNGIRESSLAQVWVFTAGEVRSMLEDAGLCVESVYGSAAREPFALGSHRALFVAVKSAAQQKEEA